MKTEKPQVEKCQLCDAEFPYRKGKRYCSKLCGYRAYEGKTRADLQRLDSKPRSTKLLRKENQQLVIDGKKRCAGCMEVKRLSAFSPSSTEIGGVKQNCKSCRSASRKQYIESLDAEAKQEILRKKRFIETQARKARVEINRLRKIARNVARAKARTEQRRQQARDKAAAKLLGWCAWAYESEHQQTASLAVFVMQSLNRQPWQLPGISGAQWYRWRYASDEEFAIKARLRRQIDKQRKRLDVHDKLRAALNRQGRAPSLESALGYTVSELRRHLEKQFVKGMSWDAFKAGEIHIDHIVPVSAFDLSDESEIAKCWALSNLRPCWASDNLAKKDLRMFLL